MALNQNHVNMNMEVYQQLFQKVLMNAWIGSIFVRMCSCRGRYNETLTVNGTFHRIHTLRSGGLKAQLKTNHTKRFQQSK